MPGARIGRDCILGQNVFVASGVRIGDGCKVQNNVSLYQGVILEEQVFVGPSVVFTNIRTPRAHIPRNDARFFASTLVRRRASLGANSTLVCGVSVGVCAMVGAGAVVTCDVAAYSLVMGVPARACGWVCDCGEGLDAAPGLTLCAACGARYLLDEVGAVLTPMARDCV
jgi:UDP-2-acetamido-3-amino-2,3-dideoxy-glucuronate N-acetyltransferase